MIENLVWIISLFMVILTVTVHYEVMTIVSDKIIPWAQKHEQSRRVMAYGIGGLLLGHIAEIWLFAFVLQILMLFPVFGGIQGDFGRGWNDFLYLSAVNYTSLGDNTLRLIGPARAMAATESLAGMMMIAWSASFAYLKMEMIWERRKARRD